MLIGILVTIMVCCLALIGFLVGRKIPLAARIQVEQVAGEQEARLKKRLIEDRLYRKISTVMVRLTSWVKPLFVSAKQEFHRWLSAIQTRERSLRVEEMRRRSDSSDSFVHVKPMIESMIASERYGDAEARLVEFIALNPKHVDAYKLLADVAIGKKDYVQAKEIYEFILKMDEKNKSAYSALGYLYSQDNQPTEARAMYERSVSLKAGDGSDYFALAKLYQATGENEKALDAVRKASELQPQNPKFLDKLAELAILLGRKVIAKNAYLKLKKANPENEKLSSIKEQIDTMK